MPNPDNVESGLPESEKPVLGKGIDPTATTSSEKLAAKKLSKEEQMALYEENLKDSDWGHQPC
jgi:hypothetical protein